MSTWELVPYRTRSGRSPVEEYLDKLSGNDVARVEVALGLLEEFGVELGMPHVRPVSRGLWELRIRGKTQHRILYVAIHDQRMLLLHAFTKKTKTTPSGATEAAISRLDDYLERVGS